jgi:hypothetical protein
MEHWYAFKAYNNQIAYGYGTAQEADRYTDHLNRNRDINHFAPRILSDAEVAQLGLEDSDLGISLSVALSDIDP